MKTNNITPTIAKILAQRVREKLSEKLALFAKNQEQKVLASKEFADFEKLREQQRQIRTKIDALENKICKMYSTSVMQVKLNTVYSSQPAEVYLRETNQICIDSIRDSILLEDYFATSHVTVEEMIDNMVKKYIS